MRKVLFYGMMFLGTSIALSQVAVGTTTPSDAAALHVEASQSNSIGIGGFLMPVVTEAEQLLIPVSTTDATDDGMMVFVSDPGTGKHCWDIYDGVAHTWRSINCFSTSSCSDILFEEDFDSYVDGTGVTGASSSNGDYPSGVTQWTLTSFSAFGSTTPALPGTLADANDYALVESGELRFRDLNGTFRLETQSINISGYSSIQISVNVRGTGDFEYDVLDHTDDFNCGETNSDYFDLEYSIDGGAYVEVSNFNSLGTVNHTIVFDETFASDGSLVNLTADLTGLSASNLIIRLRLQNWANNESIYIDDLIVRCQ
ncbi:hypothetical protein POV27_09055 [Aureisphaera galaxeae]|uniref:hypothetical protein n=1 Tax=Aureisphaera galaxeae TaxID=1538023 RepID=UPI0023507F44|nr:hypothetical protein [Aureisphaera galaxeae]MDC8004197.1 hypothetical protein [Aureisphaera galaxeae]